MGKGLIVSKVKPVGDYPLIHQTWQSLTDKTKAQSEDFETRGRRLSSSICPKAVESTLGLLLLDSSSTHWVTSKYGQ